MSLIEQLIEIIKNETKKSMRTVYYDNIRCNSISNDGILKNNTATLLRNGEYYGITIQILENIKPLLLHERIIQALKYIMANNIHNAIAHLYMEDYAKKYGIDIINIVIKKWLIRTDLYNITIDQIFNHNIILDDYDNKQITDWINTDSKDVIKSKIKIIELGYNSKTNQSVVPESWLNVEFLNGEVAHKEMDKLSTRIGKPPVTYCFIHGMTVNKQNMWATKDIALLFDIHNCIKITMNNNKLKTEFSSFTNNSEYIKWLTNNEHMKYIKKDDLIIGCGIKSIFNINPEYKKTENVSIFASRLQKCIRRGDGCVKTLIDTIDKLGCSPPYNLPDLQFIKVSASRQLIWRLFISIIEDASPYISNSDEILNIKDLIGLSILTNIDPELQFNKIIINKIKNTTYLMQKKSNANIEWHWRNGENIDVNISTLVNNNTKNTELSIYYAILYMPMMANDKIMLKKSIDLFKQFIPLEIKNQTVMYDNSIDTIESESILASYDMHCIPQIILYLQSALPFIPTEKYNTKELSKFIWNYSSSYNIRYKNKYLNNISIDNKNILLTLYEIQQYLFKKNNYTIDPSLLTCLEINKEISEIETTSIASRTAFLLLFGQTNELIIHNKKYNIIVSDDEKGNLICKIKKSSDKTGYIYLKETERQLIEKEYITNYKKQTIITTLPPNGYKWINLKKKINIEIKYDEDKIIFFINDIKLIKMMDMSQLITPLKSKNYVKLNNYLIKILKQCLYINENQFKNWELIEIMKKISITRNELNDFSIYNNWDKYSKIDPIIWRLVMVRITNSLSNNNIEIGPIDRNGLSQQDKKINYIYEGVILRLIILLSMLYPRVIKEKSNLKYSLNKNSEEYINMIETLKKLSTIKTDAYLINNKCYNIIIKTNLFEHQQNSVNRILNEITKLNKKGFIDGSSLGSGKTLTALYLMKELSLLNTDNHYGFLVLVPQLTLYETWKDEINKHTTFKYIEQKANGKLTDVIDKFTIVISYMGRMRDHPLNINWISVIIDECLSTQNSSLQTMESCNQVSSSKYGCLLMSATFFRSRFDKLLFMLKMLQTGLPEDKNYLDTILNESIICNINENTRKWIINVFKFELPNDIKKKYDVIAEKQTTSEQLYIELTKFMNENIEMSEYLLKRISELNNHKIIIYCKSKKEADKLAKLNKNIGRYPDITKQHVSTTVSQSGFGVNNLITYNAIILSPEIPSDIVVQCKGRIDRFGQQKNILYLEYVLFKDTLQENFLLNHENAKKYFNLYINPLVKYYK
jgi:hypothetical protein